MKYLVVFASLLTLISCESNTSSKSKTCTFNGEPVECSKEGSGETIQVSEAFYLTSKVTAEISVTSVEVEFLENTQDDAVETRNGYEYGCSAGTQAGQRFTYKLNGNKMSILADNNTETYTRVSKEAFGLQGSWKNVDTDEMGSTTTVLAISKDKMNITVKCEFINNSQNF